MAGGERVRIVVAEDHEIMRRAIVAELQRGCADAAEVVAEACNGEEAFSLVMSLRPDVVLMDVQMPVRSGLAAAKDLLAAASQTKVLLMSVDTILPQELLAVGACGFLPKRRLSECLVRAVLECARGTCPRIAEEPRFDARPDTDSLNGAGVGGRT